MAWYRTKKSEWFTSEDITSMQPLARILYDGLWQEADREGRLKWNPQTIKIRYLPKDDCDVEALAREIETRGNLVFYEADGQRYAWLPNFTKHQVINPRERASVLPPPGPPLKANNLKATTKSLKPKSLKTARARVDASLTPLSRDSDATVTRTSRVLDASSQLLFDAWYRQYPLKKGPRDAEKAWKAINPNEDLATAMVHAIIGQITEREGKTRNAEFVPQWKLPATWLRAHCWMDEPDTTTATGRPSIVTQEDRDAAQGRD